MEKSNQDLECFSEVSEFEKQKTSQEKSFFASRVIQYFIFVEILLIFTVKQMIDSVWSA